nr:MAG TPA: Ribbon-helix-helix protein, copG family [Caudoviricetes sp.]
MSKTSAEVKNRYNQKAYDRISYVVKKGEKDQLKQKAESLGYPSINSFISAAIQSFIELSQ